MKAKTLEVMTCVVLLTTSAMTAAGEGIERLIKLTDNRQTLYLQDTRIGDICSDRIDIVLLTTSQLNGHATAKLDDASLLYDDEESVYKMWVLASTGANAYWSIYYVVSQDLVGWSVQSIQEVLFGTSDQWDADRPRHPSVLKESATSYKMWYSVYWAGSSPYGTRWSNFIHYRNSSDGISWGSEQLTHDPGGLSDDHVSAVLHLQDGTLDRIYYGNQYQDSNPVLPYRMDVALDGVTESNIVQISPTPSFGWMGAATIIGSQTGDNHHRFWTTDSQELLKYDSFDEGQTWTVTNMCTVNSSCNYMFWIAGSLWEPCLYKLDGDINSNCRVDLVDFALLSHNWLVDCGTDPNNPSCIPEQVTMYVQLEKLFKYGRYYGLAEAGRQNGVRQDATGYAIRKPQRIRANGGEN